MLGSAAARGDAIVGGTLLLSRERGTGLISTRTEEHRILERCPTHSGNIFYSVFST